MKWTSIVIVCLISSFINSNAEGKVINYEIGFIAGLIVAFIIDLWSKK